MVKLPLFNNANKIKKKIFFKLKKIYLKNYFLKLLFMRLIRGLYHKTFV